MRHVGRFKPAVTESLLAGKNLIFISGNLAGGLVKLGYRLIVFVHRNALWTVDVIHEQITFSTAYLPDAAAKT